MNTRVIAYWLTTAVLVFAVGSGGVGELGHQWGTLETADVLGYPVYVLTILGLWKVLGALALLVPRFAGLREWAYAGIFFNMSGAAASHVFSSDFGPYAFHVVVPTALAILALVSRALTPQTASSAVRPPAATRATRFHRVTTAHLGRGLTEA
jgi:hypothetical protein